MSGATPYDHIELVVIRGEPGSGKSTMARMLTGHHHFEPDHLFKDTAGRYQYAPQLWSQACRWVHHMADLTLARGHKVVVSDVFPRLDDIQPYADLATFHGVGFTVIECTARHGSIHNVPLFEVERLRAAHEPIPEGHPWRIP